MTPGRVRLTPAGWAAVAASVLLVSVGLAVVVARLTDGPPCTVRVAGHVVELDREEAEYAAVEGTAAGKRLGLSEEDAAVVDEALAGRASAALVCRYGGSSVAEADRLDDRGLTARAARVRTAVRDRFDDPLLGGFAPGGVTSGHMPGSAHYEGRAIDAFFRPVNTANKTRGWALAHYLVAHADRLAVDTVIFDGRIWTARRADQGWRAYAVDPDGRPRDVVRVLEHRDHVHVDVAD